MHLNTAGHGQPEACPVNAYAMLSVTGFLALHLYCLTKFAGSGSTLYNSYGQLASFCILLLHTAL